MAFWQKIQNSRLLIAQAYFSDYKLGIDRFKRFHIVDKTSSDRLLLWSFPKLESDREYTEIAELIYLNSKKLGSMKEDKSFLIQQEILSNNLSRIL